MRRRKKGEGIDRENGKNTEKDSKRYNVLDIRKRR